MNVSQTDKMCPKNHRMVKVSTKRGGQAYYCDTCDLYYTMDMTLLGSIPVDRGSSLWTWERILEQKMGIA